MPPKTELMVSQLKGLNIEKRHLDGALQEPWAFRFATAADPTNGDSLSKSGNLTSLNDGDACGAGPGSGACEFVIFISLFLLLT